MFEVYFIDVGVNEHEKLLTGRYVGTLYQFKSNFAFNLS